LKKRGGGAWGEGKEGSKTPLGNFPKRFKKRALGLTIAFPSKGYRKEKAVCLTGRETAFIPWEGKRRRLNRKKKKKFPAGEKAWEKGNTPGETLALEKRNWKRIHSLNLPGEVSRVGGRRGNGKRGYRKI